MTTLWQAAARYVPKPYPGRVTLIQARVRPVFCHPDNDLGWGQLARGGVAVRMIPGRHENILAEPHVRQLAAELKAAYIDSLQAAEKRSPDQQGYSSVTACRPG
jgi:thioesterase domain-containing protein